MHDPWTRSKHEPSLSKFSAALAYIAVEQPDGTPGIGSAFLVGEGVFVAARHVVDGLRIREIATTQQSYIDAKDSDETLFSIATPQGTNRRVHLVTESALDIESGLSQSFVFESTILAFLGSRSVAISVTGSGH